MRRKRRKRAAAGSKAMARWREKAPEKGPWRLAGESVYDRGLFGRPTRAKAATATGCESCACVWENVGSTRESTADLASEISAPAVPGRGVLAALRRRRTPAKEFAPNAPPSASEPKAAALIHWPAGSFSSAARRRAIS